MSVAFFDFPRAVADALAKIPPDQLAARVVAAIDAAIARTIEHEGDRYSEKPPAVDAALDALWGSTALPRKAAE